jgi:hypothetical protein
MSAPLHEQLAVELESMARAAAAKSKPSAPMLERMARAYRETAQEEGEQMLRLVFTTTVELAGEIDASGAPLARALEVDALMYHGVL